jgi:molybdopterin-guanine dinucleotide biosynthesis protein A
MPERPRPDVTGLVAGFVLAGGESSRMGRDKALLTLEGEPLVARIAGIVEAVTGSATIIGPPERYAHLGFEVIADRVAGAGPLGGIETALGLGRAPWNLVLACDLPAVDAALLRLLVDRAAGSRADCVIPRTAGPEPLCAVYSESCAEHFRAALEAGVRKVTDALAGLEVDWIEAPNFHKLTNLNTPKDLEAYLG